MDDTISRQAAIDALGNKPLAWTEGEYELGLQQQWKADVNAIKALPSAQPEIRYYGQFEIKDPILISEQQWIPCSERLPEDSGWYIVTKNLAYDTTWVGLEWYNHENGWKYDDGKCIAWMPLPESYKGEQE